MKILFFLILLFGLNPIYGQEIKPKCLDGNCKNKIGTYIYADSSVYVGSFVDKLRSGQGKITYRNKSFYDGQWMNDKRNGNGVYIDSLGNKHEGLWVDDKENGKGKYTDLKGNVYEGSWTNGALLGYITLRYKNKSLYEGEYNNGIRGKGKFTYSDGSVYTGNFAKNKRSGYGELVYSFDLTYKGNWVSNEVDGQGEFYLTSSQVKIAEGVWKTDKTNPSDSKFISSDGLMVCYYANKNLYYGQSQEGMPNGIGTMKYAIGDVYEGNFVKGIYNGYGRLKLKDHSEYTGDWKNGLKDGFGTLTKADKSVVKGYWVKAQYLGVDKPNYTFMNMNCNYVHIVLDCQLIIISVENFGAEEIIKENEDNSELYGLINFNGKVLLNTEFELIHRIKNSCSFLVKKKGQFYFFKEGNGLVRFNYITSFDNESFDYYERIEFSDGLCMVKDGNGKIGFLDESGKEVIKCNYISAKGFSDDLCPVYNGAQWGVINKEGELIVPFSYSDINNFYEGLALVVKDSKYGYVDKLGKISIPISLIYSHQEFYSFDFQHGLATYIGDWRFIDKAGKLKEGMRFIDKSGEFVGDIYTDIDSWISLSGSFKLFSVEKTFPPERPIDKIQGYTKKYGIVNSQGLLVTPIVYNWFEIEGDFIVAMKNDKFGLIDSSGKLILEAKFTEEQVYLELNKIQPKKEFDRTYNEVNGVRKVGLINNQGQIILSPIYDSIIEVDEGSYICENEDQCYLVIF